MLKWMSAAALLIGAASAATAQDDLRLVDLTDEFDRFATSTASLEDAARVKAFEKQMGPLADGFYARTRNPKNYDDKPAR